MRQEECAVCHGMFDPWTMKEINLGRRHQYLCPKCYKKAGREASVRLAIRHNMIEAKKKK